MPSSLSHSNILIPAGLDLRTSPAAYDAATLALAPRFAAHFHPALRHDAHHAFRIAARQWRPALTIARGAA